MRGKSPHVDAYVEKSAPFARPILKKIRRLFHEACPEIDEVMKWGAPHFEYKGIVGSMCAFKAHASYGFRKASLMEDPHGLLRAVGSTSMGSHRLTDVSQLPSDKVLLAYIRQAVRLNETGAKVSKPPRTRPKKRLAVPGYFLSALRKNKRALKTFENFSPSRRNEYVEWITEAKQAVARERRLATALAWMAAGKPRNWKYM